MNLALLIANRRKTEVSDRSDLDDLARVYERRAS
jgi:hypothetical protein